MSHTILSLSPTLDEKLATLIFDCERLEAISIRCGNERGRFAGFSVRAENCLASGDSPVAEAKLGRPATLGDLVKWPGSELLKIRNFGRTALKELEWKLASIGLSLSDRPPVTPAPRPIPPTGSFAVSVIDGARVTDALVAADKVVALIRSRCPTETIIRLVGQEQPLEANEPMEAIQAKMDAARGTATPTRDSRPITTLSLPVIARNGLFRARVQTIGELTRLNENDLLCIKQVGHTSVKCIKHELGLLGLSLSVGSGLEAHLRAVMAAAGTGWCKRCATLRNVGERGI